VSLLNTRVSGFGKQRIGLLGGSFNPAHEGHLYVSIEALKRLKLDAVWWLVSPQNPLKSSKGMASLNVRLLSAHKVALHPRIRVTAIEEQLGTRYTIDTLARIKQKFSTTRFVWIMGSDNLLQIPSWYHWNQIFSTVSIAVFARESYDFKALAGMAAHRYRNSRLPIERAAGLATSELPAWTFLPLRWHSASSTSIRLSKDWLGT